MGRILAADDVTRIAKSAERLVRLVREISERAELSEPKSAFVSESHSTPVATNSSPACDHAALVDAASEAIRAHRAQPHFGAPAVFHNPLWVLILELFVASRTGHAMPVTNACLTLGGAQTMALRSILDLERRGLVRSTHDETDGRRRLLRLSEDVERQLAAYLDHADRPQSRTMRFALRMANGETPADDGAQPRLDEQSTASVSVQSGVGSDVVLQCS